jgi:hypothetical protein
MGGEEGRRCACGWDATAGKDGSSVAAMSAAKRRLPWLFMLDMRFL